MDIGDAITKGIKGIAAVGGAFVVCSLAIAVYSAHTGTPISEIMPISVSQAKTSDEVRAESNDRVVGKSVAMFEKATGVDVRVGHTGAEVLLGGQMGDKFSARATYVMGNGTGYAALKKGKAKGYCNVDTGSAKAAIDRMYPEGNIRTMVGGLPTPAVLDFMLTWHELAHCHDFATDAKRTQAWVIDTEMVADVYMAVMVFQSKGIADPVGEIRRWSSRRAVGAYWGHYDADGVARIDAGHFTSPAIEVVLRDHAAGRLGVMHPNAILSYARAVSASIVSGYDRDVEEGEPVMWEGKSQQVYAPFSEQPIAYRGAAEAYAKYVSRQL